MSTTAATAVASPLSVRAIGVGTAGGVLGGVVFGLMMQAWGMMPMVAMLVDSESVAVGWGLHLAISALFGAGFGLLAGRWFARPALLLALGLGYGVVLWVVGALAVMPARLSMDTFVINEMSTRSLIGHLVFGSVLAGFSAAAAAVMRRSEIADRQAG